MVVGIRPNHHLHYKRVKNSDRGQPGRYNRLQTFAASVLVV